jgi:hypothetical protein
VQWFICCKARLGFVAEACERGNRNLVQSNAENCLNRWGPIRFSGRTIFNSVNYNIIIIIIIIIRRRRRRRRRRRTDRYIKNVNHFNFSLDGIGRKWAYLLTWCWCESVYWRYWNRKISHIPYILDCNPHPFYSFRGLTNQCGLESSADYIRGLQLDFGKMIEPLYVP